MNDSIEVTPPFSPLCGVVLHPRCVLHPALAERITLDQLPHLFRGLTATLGDPAASPSERRYRTLALLNEIPVVATHTESGNEATLLAVRPATQAESSAYRRLLLKRLKWRGSIALDMEVEEGTEIPVDDVNRALVRVGGESVDGIRLELVAEAHPVRM